MVTLKKLIAKLCGLLVTIQRRISPQACGIAGTSKFQRHPSGRSTSSLAHKALQDFGLLLAAERPSNIAASSCRLFPFFSPLPPCISIFDLCRIRARTAITPSGHELSCRLPSIPIPRATPSRGDKLSAGPVHPPLLISPAGCRVVCPAHRSASSQQTRKRPTRARLRRA